MAFDAEKEITGLWKRMQGAQDANRRTFYLWRDAAVQMLPDKDPKEIGIKGWEVWGADQARNFYPRQNLQNPKWLLGIAQQIAQTWNSWGSIVRLDKGEGPNEVMIIWDRCPMPTAAKEYGASMSEDFEGCEAALKQIVDGLALFLNKPLKIETTRAIPRGEGACVRRLYIAE